MKFVKKSIQLMFTLSLLPLYVNCSGGGTDTSITPNSPEPTVVDHHFTYFISCSIGCSSYGIFEYSLDNNTVSEIGASFFSDIDYGYSKYRPIMISLDAKLYFTADDGTNGMELWVYDPTQAEALGVNPKMLSDISPGSSDSDVASFANLNGKLYFSADDGTNGQELWTYDPNVAVSATNPQMVYDISTGSASSSPNYLIALNGKLYMRATTSTTGQELFVYDPSIVASATNPSLVSDINSGSVGSGILDFASLDGKLYFRANDGTNGYEPWTYDPSVAVSGINPQMVYNIYSGGSSSSVSNFTALSDKLYFSANNGPNGKELWVYDPNVATSGTNPQMVYDIRSGSSSSNPSYLEAHNGKLYFSANEPSAGTELYIYDPSVSASATNPLLNDLRIGSVNSNANDMTSFQGKLFLGYYTNTYAVFSILDDSQSVQVGSNPDPLGGAIYDDNVYDVTTLTYSETVTP